EKDPLLTVQQYVRSFMKEAEPEDVFPSVTEAHLDERLGGGEPSGGAVRARALESFEYDDCDSCCCADSYKFRLPHVRLEPCQSSHFPECPVETIAVIGLDVDRRRLDLAGAEPGSKRLRVALDSVGLAERSDWVGPQLRSRDTEEPQDVTNEIGA